MGSAAVEVVLLPVAVLLVIGAVYLIARRKRLRCRVQMDLTGRDVADSPYVGALRQVLGDGALLHDPSLVLLRIQNGGWPAIQQQHYLASAADPVGVRITFPGRRVVGMVVTEFSDPQLRASFAAGAPGLSSRDSVIQLPKVRLRRGDHYKVLAVLEREEGLPDSEYADPVVAASIAGQSRTRGGRSWPGKLAHRSGSSPSVSRIPQSVSDHAQWRRAEGWLAVWLAVGAAVTYLLAYLAGRSVLDTIQSDQLGPSETAQVIAAIGALGSAIGMSTAAIIKAVALLIHARADMERARSGQPPSQPEVDPATADDQA